jgi:hypothetical protein
MRAMTKLPLGDIGGTVGMFVLAEATVVKVEVVETVTAPADNVTVDTEVTVAEFVSAPLKGANRSMLDSIWGWRLGGISPEPWYGDDPTIQPLLGESMNTEFRSGGNGARPSKEGARVICTQAVPSQ